MKYKEGPWYVPLILMGAGLVAIVTMPRTTGKAVHTVLSGTGQVITAAFGGNDGDTAPAQPISLRLPSPQPGSAQDGPPPTWNN